MAASQKRFQTILTANDVPGAKLEKNKSVCGHSKLQLKRWLQCRGLLTSGNKEALIQRVLACQNNGGAAIINSIDNGVWYNKKFADLSNCVCNNLPTLPQVETFPIHNWKKFPSRGIPIQFCYGTIYKHIIETAVLLSTTNNNVDSDEDESKENLNPIFNTSKPLRKGRRYFTSGNIHQLEDNVTKNGHYCLKSRVMASFQNKTYTVMIMLNKNLGDVLDASCECSASALGRCSHVAGLLFALEDYTIVFGFDPTACTSKLCTWNKGRSKQKTSSKVYEKEYNSNRSPMAIFSFKPDPDKYNQDAKMSKNILLSQAEYLKDNSLWSYLLDFSYPNYDLTEERRSELATNIDQLKKALSLSVSPGEVPNTKGQANNTNWHMRRKFYITASIARDIWKLDVAKYSKKVGELLWYSKPFHSRYTDYGTTTEPVARSVYEQHKNVCVETTGMWVNRKYPGLSCSPDGIVHDQVTISKGILEIKCPYVLKDFHPDDFQKLTKTQQNNFCCTVDSGGNWKLKEEHKYYFQIQMCMAILELSWCDFMIYSPKGFKCQRIEFNHAFWQNIYPKLCFFHNNILAVEYFEMRVPRKLDLFIL